LTVIGTGGFVSSTLLPAFLADGGFRLAGTVSAAGLSALTLGRRYQAGFVATDAVAAIRDDRTEAAVIGTRHDSHAELVDAALRAGKPVFVEKPLAISEAQLAGLTETADELGDDLPPVMVGYNRRWSPLVSELKRHLGRVVEPKSLLLRMNAGPIPAEHWTQDPEVGGGRIVGEGCHAVDLAEAIIGAPITRVYAADVGPRARTAPLEDNVHLTLTHADGSVTTIIYASRGDRSAGKERVELFAGELTATIDDWRALEVHRRGKRIARLAGWSQRKGYAEEVRGFREAIRTGVSPTSLVDLIRTATVCLRALDSLRLGQPIDLGTN
jgi:polar amino acid transport system substrate-binding protein